MSSSDNIKVCIRVRPFNIQEYRRDPTPCLYFDQAKPSFLTVDTKGPKADPKVFNFDWIAGESSTQQQIFEEIGRPLAETYLQGYNCCVFAYGQTGAGKTYTMQGRGLEDDIEEGEEVHRGLQPRIIDEIFALKAKEEAENPGVEFLVKCGYLEIYNEQIMDLLNPSDRNLNIREDAKEGIYIENLMEIHLESSQKALQVLRHGASNRRTGSTNMNLESSRSHSLFIMTIIRKAGILLKTSKFNFVDLAGSERQKSTNTTGILLKEAGNINKSLSMLGFVINNLVEAAEGKSRHIAYRDSKLTFILKDSLGGNSKTCLIANVSPAISSVQETISTLKFAQRAKLIKTKACINEDIGGDIEDLKKEIERLKKELTHYKQLEFENVGQAPSKEGAESLQTSRQDSTRLNSQCLEQSKRFSDSEVDQKELPFYSSLNDIQMLSSVNQRQSQCEDTIQSTIREATIQEENARLRRENQALLEALNSATAEMESYLANKEANDTTVNILQQENIETEQKLQMEIEDMNESSEFGPHQEEIEAENVIHEVENNHTQELTNEKLLTEEGTMTDVMSELVELEKLRKERTRQDHILVEKMDQLAQAENIITQQKYKLLEIEVLRQELQKEQENASQLAEKLQRAEDIIAEQTQRAVEAEEQNKALALEEYQMNALREKVSSLEQELQKLKEERLLELQTENESLHKQAETLFEQHQKLESIQETNKVLEEELERLSNERTEEEKRLKGLLEEKEKELLGTLNIPQELATLQERNKTLEAELERLTKEKSEEETRFDGMIKEKSLEVEKVTEELAIVQERNKALEEELQRLTNEKDEAEKCFKSLLEEKEKEVLEASKIPQELAAFQERNKVLEAELQRLTNEKSEEELCLKNMIKEKEVKSLEVARELLMVQERNKTLEEELERLINEKNEEEKRLKNLLENKEKAVSETSNIPQELAASQERIRILGEHLERLVSERNEEREMANVEEKRLKSIIEEQTEKSLKDESKIQELEKSLEVEREEKLSLEKILQDDIQDCSQSRAHIRTKEDNLNRLQEQLLLKEQNTQDLNGENRLLEEARIKQESLKEMIRTYQNSLVREEEASAKYKGDLEEAETLNQELFKQIEILNEEKSKCQECSRRKIPEAPKEDEEEKKSLFALVNDSELFKEDGDDKENHFRSNKESVVSKLERTQSDCKEIIGKRSYEKVNIERGVFSEQKESKREAKDWDLADDNDDYDDLKLVKKVKPTVQ